MLSDEIYLFPNMRLETKSYEVVVEKEERKTKRVSSSKHMKKDTAALGHEQEGYQVTRKLQ